MLNPSPGCVRRLFRSPRRQTAYDHKRDQDGKRDSKFQCVFMLFSVARMGVSGLAQ